jgi:hypothetical protein
MACGAWLLCVCGCVVLFSPRPCGALSLVRICLPRAFRTPQGRVVQRRGGDVRVSNEQRQGVCACVRAPHSPLPFALASSSFHSLPSLTEQRFLFHTHSLLCIAAACAFVLDGVQVVARRLLKEALGRGSSDNITVLVVDLQAQRVVKPAQPLPSQGEACLNACLLPLHECACMDRSGTP